MSEEEINKALKIIFGSNWEQVLQNIKDLQQKVEQLENIRKEAIEFILDGRYGEDDDLESISLYMPDLLNILNKGENNGK